jgi:photosystem II stability/assembly factor-like uncharacterized protein
LANRVAFAVVAVVLVGLVVTAFVLQNSQTRANPPGWREFVIPNATGARGLNRLECISTVSPGTAYASFWGGFYRTTDCGRTWRPAKPTREDCWAYAVFANSRGVTFAGSGRGIYRSEDNGNLWSLAGVAVTLPAVYCFAEGPDGRLYAGANNGRLLVSVDCDRRWTLLYTFKDSGDSGARDLAVDSAGHLFALVYVGYYTVGRSDDGGRHWKLSPQFTDEYCGESNIFVTRYGVLCCDAFAIWRSPDGLGHWTNVSPPGGRCYSFAAAPDGTLFASTEKGCYISNKRGSGWERIRLPSYSSAMGLVTVEPNIAAAAFDKEGRIYAGTYTGRMYVSKATY